MEKPEYCESLYDILDAIDRLRIMGQTTASPRSTCYYDAAEKLIEVVVKRCSLMAIWSEPR